MSPHRQHTSHLPAQTIYFSPTELFVIPNSSGDLARCVYRIVLRIREVVEASTVMGVQRRICLLRKGREECKRLCLVLKSYVIVLMSVLGSTASQFRSLKDPVPVSLSSGTCFRGSV